MGRLIDRFIFGDDVELSCNPSRRTMNMFVLQTMAFSAFSVCTGGVYLTGYLLYLGASDRLASYVPILGNVCSIILVFLSTFIDRHENRKQFCIGFCIAGRATICLIVLVPLFSSGYYRYSVAFVLLVASQIASGISSTAYNIWYNAVIPSRIKGRFYSARSIPSLLISLLLPLTCGALMDSITAPYTGFLVLFAMGALFGTCEILCLTRIESAHVAGLRSKTSLLKAIRLPLHNKAFIKYTLHQCLFYICLYLSASFSQIYLMRYLNMSYTFISVSTILSTAIQMLLFYKFWGRVSDRVGTQFALAASVFFYGLEMLCWVFAGPSTIVFVFPLINIIIGIETPGFAISSFSRRYEIIPEEGRAIYEAFFSCAIGIALFISPLAGSALRDALWQIPVLQSGYLFIRASYLLSSASLFLLVFVYRGDFRSRNPDAPGGHSVRVLWDSFRRRI